MIDNLRAEKLSFTAKKGADGEDRSTYKPLLESQPLAVGTLVFFFREAFRVFDREGHGFITVPDLIQVLTSLGDKLTQGKRNQKLADTQF